MRIVLLGMRGSGKSTVARHLSKKLGWKFIETDRLIEEKARQKIASLAKNYGWKHFRKLETDVIQSLGNREKVVIATGGGVVLHKENMKILKNNSLSIYLQASIQTLLKRCKNDHNRPFLTKSKTLEDDFKKTLRRRENLYRKYADFSVTSENKSIEEVADEIFTRKICCIIGSPIAHSLSPAMHNSSYKALGLNYLFLAFDVTDLKSCVESIRDLRIIGCSVTVPHKIKVMEYLDEIDETAKTIRAVNTIINRNGKLRGLNTDWEGALDALKERTQVSGKKVALLGAGGAARGVAYGLKKEGAVVSIFNRNIGHAKSLAKDLKLDGYFSLNEGTRIKEYDIVINATSVGMGENKSAIKKDSFVPEQIVFDIVYSPRMTTFLKMAKDVGCSIITGNRMLLHCVKRQFELFTGYKAPLNVMESVLAC